MHHALSKKGLCGFYVVRIIDCSASKCSCIWDMAIIAATHRLSSPCRQNLALVPALVTQIKDIIVGKAATVLETQAQAPTSHLKIADGVSEGTRYGRGRWTSWALAGSRNRTVNLPCLCFVILLGLENGMNR
jgi:hypothetical protein